MEHLDAERAAGRPARLLDGHFISGVKFGLGCFNLMLSILPTSLLKLVEFIGFSSDRNFGLSLLESQGGWESFHKDPEQPLPEQTDARSGLRRQFCDMVIITYHTVISTFMPVPDADPIFSERLIQFNLTKYPSGVFFLYFSGRSLAARGLLDEAILQFKKTIEIQREWRQLQHICYWELGLLFLMKGEWESAHECFEILSQESNWSKATYTYFSATALYDQAQDMTNQEEKEKAMKKVEALMKSIPKLTKKIAGKSIPVEVRMGFPYSQFFENLIVEPKKLNHKYCTVPNFIRNTFHVNLASSQHKTIDCSYLLWKSCLYWLAWISCLKTCSNTTSTELRML